MLQNITLIRLAYLLYIHVISFVGGDIFMTIYHFRNKRT